MAKKSKKSKKNAAGSGSKKVGPKGLGKAAKEVVDSKKAAPALPQKGKTKLVDLLAGLKKGKAAKAPKKG